MGAFNAFSFYIIISVPWVQLLTLIIVVMFGDISKRRGNSKSNEDQASFVTTLLADIMQFEIYEIL